MPTTQATQATQATKATQPTEATQATKATQATETTQATEATQLTEATETVEKPVLEVRNLWKVFRSYYDRPRSFKEALLRLGRGRFVEVSALRGVSFTVRASECVAVIGKNGSGKTTLLATLGKVFRPTSGQCIVRGRTATLLGVSGGFHPELTGLENLRIVAPILGLPLKGLNQRADDIAEFAELQGSFEAPLRTFSSGMVTRLGFSLGVHADPDIFLIDEQIHAADEPFQRKVLRKLQELHQQGKTIIFVTHDLRWIETLASRALWLEQGELKADGKPAEVLEQYLAFSTEDER